MSQDMTLMHIINRIEERTMRLAILLVVILVFPAVSVAQSTWYVPDDFVSIQRAINGASDGGTIIVRQGTYFENINFEGMAVTLKSHSGPDVTVIDGSQSGSVVTCNSNENQSSVLDGFFITNGSGTYDRYGYISGGGMFNFKADPTIIHCTFIKNRAGRGGGMYNDHSDPTLTNCIFKENEAYNISGTFNGDGGGMFNHYSNPTVVECTFHGNEAYWEGGGMLNLSSAPIVVNSTFKGNTTIATWGRGGGIHNGGGSPVVSNCIFVGNSVLAHGGGMNNYSSNPTLTNCIFIGNSATEVGGGGIFNDYYSNPSLSNCIFTGNYGSKGGGMRNWEYSSPKVTNCTLIGNTANEGGGVFNELDSSPEITNSIFWSDTPDEIINKDLSNPSVTYCCCQGGYPGEGNINADPLFADLDNDDFHLTRLSPCINRGTNEDAPPDDMDGDLRPFMGTVDMGADEYTGIHTLSAQDFTLSQSAGGMIPFTLDAGSYYRNRWYCIFGTMSGTAPGQPLPGGWVTLPINGDEFTNIVVSLLNTQYCANFLGVLNGTGMGTAYLHLRPGTLPLAWIGGKMHFAFAVDTFDMASNPVEVEITP